MIFISSVGLTLVTLAYLEKQGKLSLNHNILYGLILIFAVWKGWEGVKVITETFLLNI